jgi:hypothetical protein
MDTSNERLVLEEAKLLIQDTDTCIKVNRAAANALDESIRDPVLKLYKVAELQNQALEQLRLAIAKLDSGARSVQEEMDWMVLSKVYEKGGAARRVPVRPVEVDLSPGDLRRTAEGLIGKGYATGTWEGQPVVGGYADLGLTSEGMRWLCKSGL